MRLQNYRSSVPTWWIVSAAAGIGIPFLSGRLASLSGSPLWLLPLLAPAVIGYLEPRSPWRWALAYFLGGRVAFFLQGDEIEVPASVLLGMSLILVLPLNLGATYLGSWLRSSRRTGRLSEDSDSQNRAKGRRHSRASAIWPLATTGAFLGVLIFAIPRIFNYGEELSSWMGFAVLMLGTLGVSLIALSKDSTSRDLAWKSAASVGIGWMLAGVCLIAYEIATDPTGQEHNLFPFELVAMSVMAALPVVLGVVLGLSMERVTGRTRAAGVVVLLITLTGLSIYVADRARRMNHRQEQALKNLEMLAVAQRDYRVVHPDLGFSCDIQTLNHPWIDLVQPKRFGSLRGNAVVLDGYSLLVDCAEDSRRLPQMTYRLWVIDRTGSHRDPRFPPVIYCLDESLTVRSIDSPKTPKAVCPTQGEIVTAFDLD